MWGYHIRLNRELGKYFHSIITSKLISYWYRIYLLINTRGADQFLLAYYFWPIARTNSTIHDSYHCQITELGGEISQPFPTQRPNASGCHVGAIGCCDTKANSKKHSFKICPEQCRPTEHIDWIYC